MVEHYETSIGGLSLPHCIMNASGPICTTWDELEKLQCCPDIGAIVTKSATLEPREGNPEPRWSPVPSGGGIQSMGLPNEGYKAYLKYVHDLKDKSTAVPVIVSVSGLKLEDNMKMLQEFLAVEVENGGADAIELNLSCPNIPVYMETHYQL
eukprot:GHVH01003236.1.p2 GENE.GHVH01003236.1~~GHVH01003236.1.p2  ORF type:complete len:152 (+),score=24.40 GHVH01003236.1:109-564(+)